MATRPKAVTVSKRVAALERQLSELGQWATLVATHRATMPMLTGWSEISAYCRKKRRTLSRYVKELDFPAYRFGRHVVSSPSAIDTWLLVKTTVRKKQRDCVGSIAPLEHGPRKTQAAKDQISNMSDSDLKARVRELDVNLKR